ncbi:WxL protein peptidoglycan domain-containing protein [Amycolatopsis vancoresmycina]|uniref:DUF916 domain-containing protein n=1 Tax=Amycolatopsis vancoresmycina DSM 44592 TaxID=1292037 RepID=R1I3U7_9PSEU|nr:DUF916 domain-containing protein [Amycolatopsis vancoresmycina]EOD67186.1 hypothetical protein H480_17750 [Amycolatopsis vancoresmycina DSM 44592]
MPSIARAVVSLLAATAFAGATAGPVAAQDAVPWTITTAANDFGADRENFTYTADAGEQITDGLTITNHGTSPLELAVYGADAFTTGTGQLDLLAKTKPSTGVGAWVHPSTDHLTVQAGQTAEVLFTVMVPSDAKAGDHLGGILTSVRDAGRHRQLHDPQHRQRHRDRTPVRGGVGAVRDLAGPGAAGAGLTAAASG